MTKSVWLKALGKTRQQQIARYYLGQTPSKIAARRRPIKSSQRWLAEDRNISHGPVRRARGKWFAQTAAALLLVTLGWVGRGQTDARLGSVPPIVAEADEARDMIVASVPKDSPGVTDYRRLAQANGLPTVAMPVGWGVTSSGVVSTEHGPMLQVPALTKDGDAVTIIASNDSQGTSHVPVIRIGNDESIASWNRGSSGFAVAAQTSAERLHRAALELYDSGVVSWARPASPNLDLCSQLVVLLGNFEHVCLGLSVRDALGQEARMLCQLPIMVCFDFQAPSTPKLSHND